MHTVPVLSITIQANQIFVRPVSAGINVGVLLYLAGGKVSNNAIVGVRLAGNTRAVGISDTAPEVLVSGNTLEFEPQLPATGIDIETDADCLQQLISTTGAKRMSAGATSESPSSAGEAKWASNGGGVSWRLCSRQFPYEGKVATPLLPDPVGLSMPCIPSQRTKASNQPVLVVSFGYIPKPWPPCS